MLFCFGGLTFDRLADGSVMTLIAAMYTVPLAGILLLAWGIRELVHRAG
jgi:hypothetical protein